LIIFRNFAAVNTKTKRQIASWVLLAVFLPILILSSVHVHGNANVLTDECHECVKHHCHGHLGQQSASLQACVLCQFLTLPMVSVAVAALTIYNNNVSKIRYAQRQRVVYADACGIPALRAPPAV